jgi:hypothetical protein
MFRVNHKIVSKENNFRTEDRYTIFNHCIFRKRINYLFIGLNPSSDSYQFTDSTNLWIINWILENDKSGGYYLTNLCKDVSSTAEEGQQVPNEKLDSIIKKHSKLKVCIFYGSEAVKNKQVNFNEESKQIILEAFKNHLLFTTSQNGRFRHISMSSKELEIVECRDLSTIGINI